MTHGTEHNMNRSIRSVRPGVLLGVFLAYALMSLTLSAKPKNGDFSKTALDGVHEAVQKHIDAGDVAGAVTLIYHDGHIVYFEPQGMADAEAKKPMQKNSVFWVASMSKPITATAVMILVEEGKIRLTDPISKFIPEFKAPATVTVAKPGAAGQSDLVPASHAITIQDLLTHTSGLLSGGGGAGIGQAQGAFDYLHVTGDTLATAVPRLGGIPLDFQPGTKWAYSARAGFDILARVVEVVSGQTFDRFLKQRIFDPLGMNDTGFGPPKDSSRAVSTKPRNPNVGTLQAMIDGSTYFSGAAGLRSTTEDYLKFAEMLLNGGELKGKRVLKPATVAMMTSNHVGDVFNIGTFTLPKEGMGFGLGVAVITNQAASGLPFPTGSFMWTGIQSSWFWVMPKEKMILLMMCPPTMTGPVHVDLVKAMANVMPETKSSGN
jgi:CubicO group peptidase (beta-lactamase class C family)